MRFGSKLLILNSILRTLLKLDDTSVIYQQMVKLPILEQSNKLFSFQTFKFHDKLLLLETQIFLNPFIFVT